MTIRQVLENDTLEISSIQSSYFLIGLISAFDNRFQSVADRVMEEMSWKQFFAIICISLCRESPSVKELAAIMGSSHQNVKQILLKLERKGFVTIQADNADKRILRIQLTEACLDFCKRNDTKAEPLVQRMFEGISEEDLRTTIRTLIAIDDRLKEAEVYEK